jgi:hypothetical protein
MDSPESPCDTQVQVIFVARLLPPVAQKLCRCERGVFANRFVFILEYYFALKTFDAVREALTTSIVPNILISTLKEQKGGKVNKMSEAVKVCPHSTNCSAYFTVET